MTLRYTENIDGKVYICDTQSDYDKPVLITLKYLTSGASVIPSGLPVTMQGNAYVTKFNHNWMAVNPLDGLGNIICEKKDYPKPGKGYKYYYKGEWHRKLYEI